MPGVRPDGFTLAVTEVLPDPFAGETLSQLPPEVVAATTVKLPRVSPPRVCTLRRRGAGAAELVPTCRKNRASGLTARPRFAAWAENPASQTARDIPVKSTFLYGILVSPFIRGGNLGKTTSPTLSITGEARDEVNSTFVLELFDPRIWGRSSKLVCRKMKMSYSDLHRKYMDEEFLETLPQPKADLAGALERDEFQLHYQPVVALDRNQIVGFEALVRWMHPIRGVVYPGEFLPLVESGGLTVPLTRWIVREVCRQQGRWQTALKGTLPLIISTNFPVQCLGDAELMREVGELVSSPKIPAGALWFEINEAEIFPQSELIARSWAVLKEMGIGVVIDEFGFQYASLRHLTSYQACALKMSRSIVENVGRDPASKSLAQATIWLGTSLGIEVIAKGVEKAEQLNAVRELQCPYAQGFYFSPPQDPDAAFLSYSETQSRENSVPLDVARLQAFEIFAGMNPEDLQQIVPSCKELAVPEDTLLIRQGQIGTRVYLLEEGTVSIYKGAGEVQHFLRTLDAPAIVGEMAVADPERIRTANVRSLTGLRLLSLSLQDFLLFLRRFPALGKNLRQLLAQRSR
jgi:EAL domain-containing protein (putative c-di-GMP-specific phosphodiesterase class I)